MTFQSFNHKVLYVRCERIPEFNSPRNSLNFSQLIILNLFKYTMLRFLQFWCKLNTRRILKHGPFRFLCDYYTLVPSMLLFPGFVTISYHFPWCFRMFPLMFLRFLAMFLQFLHSVSPVSYFRFCECELLRNCVHKTKEKTNNPQITWIYNKGLVN